MTQTRLEVEAPDGRADGRLFVPAGRGPWPLVVQYMDAGGLRPAMNTMAEPLVAAGYAVVQPNLYWRSGPFAPFDARTVFVDPTERARVMKLLHAVRADQAMADTRLFVDAVGKDRRIATDALRFVGYCMGGRLAFVAATTFGDRAVAVAPIHAGGLVTDGADSPHLAAAKIRARLYLGVADADGSCTPEHQRSLREALDAAGVGYTMELHPGARHGFAMPDFPVYEPAAAGRVWERVLALFA